jgi:hypothetical protein
MFRTGVSTWRDERYQVEVRHVRAHPEAAQTQRLPEPGLRVAQHVLCPPTETDQNGVDFSWHCVTLDNCKRQNLCLGHCKLY